MLLLMWLVVEELVDVNVIIGSRAESLTDVAIALG